MCTKIEQACNIFNLKKLKQDVLLNMIWGRITAVIASNIFNITSNII